MEDRETRLIERLKAQIEAGETVSFAWMEPPFALLPPETLCKICTRSSVFGELLSYTSDVGVGVEGSGSNISGLGVEESGSNCQGCNSCLPYQTIPRAR